MGKTLSRDQLKNSKYLRRDNDRANKFRDIDQDFNETNKNKKAKSKQKWRPHSQIEEDD